MSQMYSKSDVTVTEAHTEVLADVWKLTLLPQGGSTEDLEQLLMQICYLFNKRIFL